MTPLPQRGQSGRSRQERQNPQATSPRILPQKASSPATLYTIPKETSQFKPQDNF